MIIICDKRYDDDMVTMRMAMVTMRMVPLRMILTWQCVVDVGIPAILQTITTTEAVRTTVNPKLWGGN